MRFVDVLPNPAEKALVVRQDDELRNSRSQSAQFLHSRKRAMFIKTGNRVIDDDNPVCEHGVTIDSCEEESQRECVAVARAQSVSERGFSRPGRTTCDRDWSAVNYYLVVARRTAARIYGSDPPDAESRAKAAQVYVNPNLILGECCHSVPFKICLCTIAQMLSSCLRTFFSQVLLAMS